MENPQPTKNKNWFLRHKIATAVIAFIVLAAIGSASQGGSTNTASKPAPADKPTTTATSSPTPAPAPKAAAPAAPQVLLDLSGSGTKQTQQFTAKGNWDLNFSYDCSSFGQAGNFIVEVYGQDGTPSLVNQAVNQTGASGTDVQHYYKGGTYYLAINSECSWHVTAKG